LQVSAQAAVVAVELVRRTASASHTAPARSRCIRCGPACSARSANCQHERVSTSERTPSSQSCAAMRVSTRLNRPAMRANAQSKYSIHASGLLWPQRPSRGCFCPQRTIVQRWPSLCPRTRDLYQTVTKRIKLSAEHLHHELRLY
jgi:hypothetical protein